jgi:hypothetical protein
MSIVRWCKQTDGQVSDVYIYYDIDGGITCHSAKGTAEDFNVATPEELIERLKSDEFKDHHIPAFVFERETYD